ncbi:MAG: GNAT family N-acetyltransferase, partial [Chloroflexota bacterium]|nr:GNAT family N-acetyltransferase [Chloroflexota bacterium]
MINPAVALRPALAQTAPQDCGEYYLTLAARPDYPLVEALDRQAAAAEMPIPLTAASIEWLVDRNPAGQGFVVLARERSDDAIIGHFLFYPHRLYVREEGEGEARPIVAFLYVSLFVAPPYRRRGVFTAMAVYGLDVLRRADVRFAYTVPNPRSTAGFLKMGMHRIGTVPFWASPYRLGGRLFELAARPAAWQAGSRFRVEPAGRFDERHEALVREAPPQRARVWGARTQAELGWRFGRPGVAYTVWNLLDGDGLAGYAVTREMHIAPYDALVLCDLWLRRAQRSALAFLLNEIRHRLHQSASHLPDLLIAMCGWPAGADGRSLLAAGFLPVPQRLLPQPVALVGGPLEASL